MHCLAWTAVALILELTQHSGIASLFADAVTVLLPVSISEIILPYWSRGSFDWLDLLATAAGGLFALAILRYVADGGEPWHG